MLLLILRSVIYGAVEACGALRWVFFAHSSVSERKHFFLFWSGSLFPHSNLHWEAKYNHVQQFGSTQWMFRSEQEKIGKRER
jgi:hypothetical protein